MALPTTYSTGTATVNANEVAVVGQGTTWLTSGLQAGDLFWAGGMSVRIAAVISNTSLTLAFAWPGASRAAQQYEVRFTPDATRVLASARAVLDAIAGGNVKAIGDLVSAADKLPYFTGAGTAGLTSLTAFARNLIGAADAPAARSLLGVSFTSGPGWIRLQPSNLLIQFGNPVFTLSAFGTGIVSLPTPFSNANYTVVAMNGDSAIDYEFQWYVGGGYPNASQFALQAKAYGNLAIQAGNVRASYVAFGV